MKKKNLRFIYNSISFKMILIIIITLTPLISLLIFNNYQARASLLEHIEATHKNMLQTYMTQIDSQINNSMGYSLDMVLYQNDPNILLTEHDDSNIAITKYKLFTSLSNRLPSNNLIDTFFVYIKSRDYFIAASQSRVTPEESSALQKYVFSFSESLGYADSLPKSKWFFSSIDNGKGLINLSYTNGDILAGIYTSTDRFINEFKKNDSTGSRLAFLSKSAISTETNKIPDGTELITIQSSTANICLAEYLPKAKILQSLPFMQKYVLLISIVFALTMPLLILLMNLIVANPLHRLMIAMGRVRIGDLSHRIDIKQSSNEFEIVNETFNNMMDTVQNLKINVYEEQIKVQKSQLRNLQLQIKPHFLINSLNMVNNLIYNGNLTTAKELILHSVDYFRYMAKADNDFVPLNEEIKHITDYLEIQKIRYKDKFTYSITTNQLIEDMLIPPMLVQNFVENSVKYAIRMNNVILISVKVEYFEVDYYPYAKITISDTGVGYPTDILQQLNSGKKIIDALGHHIGIFNSVQRMKILFEGKACWKFYNDGGAVSEITFPAKFENQNTED